MISEPGLVTQQKSIPSKKCPYAWIKEFAKNSIESSLINGNLLSLFNLFTEQLQSHFPFLILGRTFAQYVQINGKFVSITNISEPMFEIPGSDIWTVLVQLISESGIEFLISLNITGNKKISGFNFTRLLIYHPPSYVKKELIEEQEINEDPYIIIDKPISPTKKSSNSKEFQYPCALLIHTEYEADVNIKLGICSPAIDFLYLPSNKISLVRGEYSDSMFNHEIINGKILKYNDPVLIYATKMIELSLSQNDVSHIFLILHSFASLSLGAIVKKFQGIIQGIILINPFWNSGPDLCINSMKEEYIPKDVPILLLGGGYAPKNIVDDFKHWEAALKKLGQESEFYDHCDLFLFESEKEPLKEEYEFFEKHVSDVPLRRIAQFIRAHSNS